MRESDITTKILKVLSKRKDVHVFKNHATRFQRRGTPDIVGNVGKRVLWLEVKRPGGKPSSSQLIEHSRILSSGSLVWIVSSVGEALDAVEILSSASEAEYDRLRKEAIKKTEFSIKKSLA